MSASVTVVASNVQTWTKKRRAERSARWLRRTSASLFLLTETQTPAHDGLASECELEFCSIEPSVAGAYFPPGSSTALLWRRSTVMPDDPSDRNAVSRGLGNPAMSARVCDAVFGIDGQPVRVLSVYAPSGETSGPHTTTRRALFDALRRLFEANPSLIPAGGVILGGDFNCVLDPSLDSSAGARARRDAGADELEALLASCALQDTFRHLNAAKVMFTNEMPGLTVARRRLDRIYASPQLVGRTLRAGSWARLDGSTHCPVFVALSVGGPKRGPPSWRLNTTMLQDERTMEAIARRVRAYADERAHDLGPLAHWDAVKRFLRDQLIAFSMLRTMRQKRDEEEEARGLAKRARLPTTSVISAGLHLRVRQMRDEALIPSLTLDGGRTVTEPAELTGAAATFFGELFSVRPTDLDAQADLNAGLDRRVSAQQCAQLDRPFTLEEVEGAIKKSQSDKSPGPDGLPMEVYRNGPLFEALKDVLITAFRAAPVVGHLPESMREIDLTLVFKEGGERDRLKSYRPLAPGNADAKIYAQVLHRRLADVLPEIIGPSQRGFVPGRRIDDAIEQMREVFDTPDAVGFMAISDFTKAFDRVQRSAVASTLIAFGFPPRFRAMVMAALKDTLFRVVVNGWRSAAIPMSSGVCQGSPLSTDIFAITVEPLLKRLRDSIKGIRLRHIVVRESGFADDLATGLADVADARAYFSAVDLYERATGGRLSAPKTFLEVIGAPPDRDEVQAVVRAGIRLCSDHFRYLGVICGYGVKPEDVWDKLVEQIRRRLSRIPRSDLPIAMRCDIVRVFTQSIITFADRFTPAPARHVDELARLFVDVGAWCGRKHVVSVERLCTPAALGGMGLLDVRAQLRGQRAEQVRRLAFGSTDSSPALLERRAKIQHAVRLAHPIAAFGPTATNAGVDPRAWSIPPTRWNWTVVLAVKQAPKWMHAPKALAAAQVATRGGPWHDFFVAWRAETKFEPPAGRGATTVLASIEGDESALVGRVDKKLFTPDVSMPKLLNHGSKRAAVKRGPIVPTGQNALRPRQPERWGKFWTALAKLKRVRPVAADTYHLFALGSLKTADHGGRYVDADRPWAASLDCALCGAAPETTSHLWDDCTVAEAIWSASGSRTPRPRRLDLACPTENGKISPDDLIEAVVYVHTVWKLRNIQRFRKTAPGPIDTAAYGRRIRVAIDSVPDFGQEDDSDDE